MSSIHDPDVNPALDLIISQAPVAARFWMQEAEQSIDEQFGAGYAEKHPALISGFIHACSLCFLAARIVDAGQLEANRG